MNTELDPFRKIHAKSKDGRGRYNPRAITVPAELQERVLAYESTRHAVELEELTVKAKKVLVRMERGLLFDEMQKLGFTRKSSRKVLWEIAAGQR